MEFRLNFFISTTLYFLWAGIGFLTIFIIYGKVDSIAGWTQSEALLLLLVFNTMNAVYKTLFHRNINGLVDHVRQGTLDFLLTKPMNLRFVLSLRHIKFDQLPRLFVFLVGIIYFAPQINASLSISDWIAGGTLMLTGLIGMQSLTFIIMCYVFWRPRIWNLFAIIGETLNLAQYPSDIYRGTVHIIVAVLPIAVYSTIPTMFLLGRGSPNMYFEAMFISFAFFILSVIILRLGVRRYESASS